MQLIRAAGNYSPSYRVITPQERLKTNLEVTGNNERRCITRDVLGLYGSIVTVGTYASQGYQDLSKDLVSKVLKECIDRLPTLAIVVQDSETEKPQLARAASIDLNKHVHQSDQSISIQDLLRRAHNEPLTDYESRPQWRLYIAPDGSSFHVAFATSHALADGKSGFIFHKTFLEALRTLAQLSHDADPICSPSMTRTLQPALEQAGNLSISWSFLIGPLVGEYCPPWLARMLGMSKENPNSSQAWCGAPTRPARKSTDLVVETAVHVTAVPPELLQSALTACRKHDARLTSLLNHLMCRALARSLRARGQQFSSFLHETAIDLRRCLPAECQQSMGNFVSAVTETTDIPPSSLDAGNHLPEADWQTIQDSTTHLAERSNTLADQPTGLLKYLSNYREWILKKASTTEEASFGMSNLGTFDGTGESSWIVKDVVFSQSADATGAPFNLNVASGEHGSLMLVVTWMPGMFGLQDESLFVKDTMKDVVTQLEGIPA